jgi:predicted P-loop ATPase
MEGTHETHKIVTDYLSSLAWDGTPRLDRWLVDCAGAEDTPDVCVASRMILVAAVHRARHPGCRFDQTLVIDGPQGCGKSSALRVLAVEDGWFTDFAGLVAPDTRRFIEATNGAWIVEVGELESWLERAQDDEKDREAAPRRTPSPLKAFLARTHDEARLAHRRGVTRVPRSFVVVGTTSAADYLGDPTGNRRFMTVRVLRFDLERLRAIRDQLWAEAAIVETAGEAIHLVTCGAPNQDHHAEGEQDA